MSDLSTQRYALFVLLTAVLFGMSAPVAKRLGASIEPVLLAALLYIGSGLSLLTLRGLRAGLGRTGAKLRCDVATCHGWPVPPSPAASPGRCC